MAEITETILKEKIKAYTGQIDALKVEITALRAKITEKEDVGKQLVGGLKTLQEMAKIIQ